MCEGMNLRVAGAEQVCGLALVLSGSWLLKPTLAHLRVA
jgi:hypothetical protein